MYTEHKLVLAVHFHYDNGNKCNTLLLLRTTTLTFKSLYQDFDQLVHLNITNMLK